MVDGDTIITGLCAVARHICKHRSTAQNDLEHNEGLLGFRKSCLQAPNEASIWTKFCEIDILKTVNEVLKADLLQEVPVNMVRFENHLRKPVKVHNVYKVARELTEDKKESIDSQSNINNNQDTSGDTKRENAKNRKWKSKSKSSNIDCSIKIEDLKISHQFAEGPFFTLADLILLPSFYIIMQTIGESLKTLLPRTYQWYTDVLNLIDIISLDKLLCKLDNKSISVENLVIPTIQDVSLYKSDTL